MPLMNYLIDYFSQNEDVLTPPTNNFEDTWLGCNRS